MRTRMYDLHYNIDRKISGQMLLNFQPPSTKSTSLRIQTHNSSESVMILFSKKETEEILNFLAARLL